MKINQLLLLACLLFTLSATAFAQQDHEYAQESEFSLHRYSPEWVNSDSLAETIHSLYGRVLYFEGRSVENLTILEDSLVIYETKERMDQILKAIATLDFNTYPDYEPEQDTSYDINDMVIKTYHPINMDSGAFFSLATELYGGDVQVGDDSHSKLRYAQGRGIIIFDIEDSAQELLEKLTTLDESQAMGPENRLVMMEYSPRFVSPKGLMEGIQSFNAIVFDPRGDNHSGAINISLMKERGLIVVRDQQERAMEIMQALKHLDQPLPQTMLICQIIQGSNQEPEAGAVRASQEIEQQLNQVLPHKYYTVSGSGMLRTGVAAGTRLELFMDHASPGSTWQYQLEMVTGAFDSEQGSLNLDQCELSMRSFTTPAPRNLFRTSTTIYQGEYAVLGVTGAEPLFLVVQLLAVKTN